MERNRGLLIVARLALLLLIASVLVGCDRQDSLPEERILRWSRSSDVQQRRKPIVYMFQRYDGSWTAISTAVQEEAGTGLVYDRGEILSSGFLVYPGGNPAGSIDEAITIARRTRSSPRPADDR